MATAYRGNNIDDQNDVPISGAKVYVYDSANALATLTDISDQAITQPVPTGESGEYGYKAEEGLYREEIFVDGQLRFQIENVIVGDDYLTQVQNSEREAEQAVEIVRELLAEQQALSSIDYFVDTAGSDSNAGTEAAPFATIKAARAVASANDVIGLKRGQTHYIASDETSVDNMVQSIVGYGTSPDPATISAGQDLSGKTWTVHSGDVWKTTITLSESHLGNGSGSNTNTTYPFVRQGESYFTWAVGGADIAANLTTLASLEGGFAINVTSDTNEDIRDATSATAFDLYVRMPNGTDPNGVSLTTLNWRNCYKFDCERLQDLILRDAWGKDNSGTVSTPTNVPRLRRIETRGCGCHGWVGTAEAWGYKATGVPRPGMSATTNGHAAGAGLNLFTDPDRSGVVVKHRGVDCEKFVQGYYAHTGTSANFVGERHEFHPAVDAGWNSFRVKTCNTAMQLDAKSGASTIGDGIYVYTAIDWDDLGFGALNTPGKMHVLGGGTCNFGQNTNGSRQVIITGVGDSIDAKFSGVTFTADVQNSLSFDKLLYRITDSSPANTPEIEFAACTLPVEGSDDHFFVPPTSATEVAANLTLSIGTVTGDVIESGRTQYPDDFTVTHDVQFGFADQTSRADVRTLLTTASKTHSIDDDTTLVRLDGTTAESPA